MLLSTPLRAQRLNTATHVLTNCFLYTSTGAMELHAMYLKSKGAMVARTLSYQGCEFSAISDVMSEETEKVYDKSSDLWTEMHSALVNEVAARKKRTAFFKQMDKIKERQGFMTHSQKEMLALYADSDDEGEEASEAEVEASQYRKNCRKREGHVLNSIYWGAHQRFFRSLCIASKVDVAIQTAKEALGEGHCCIIGLQSTGEARAKNAAKQAGLGTHEDGSLYLDDYISDSKEGTKRILMNLFPLPPKPKGVLPPEFLKPKACGPAKNVDYDEDDDYFPDHCSSKQVTEKKQCIKKNDDKETVVKQKHSVKAKQIRKQDLSKPSWQNTDIDDLFSSDEEMEDEYNHSFEELSSEPIPWNEIDLHKTSSNPTSIRRKDYRKACERLQRWFEAVDSLELPANSLDRLLNELGGPRVVAGNYDMSSLPRVLTFQLLIIFFFPLSRNDRAKDSSGPTIPP